MQCKIVYHSLVSKSKNMLVRKIHGNPKILTIKIMEKNKPNVQGIKKITTLENTHIWIHLNYKSIQTKNPIYIETEDDIKIKKHDSNDEKNTRKKIWFLDL